MTAYCHSLTVTIVGIAILSLFGSIRVGAFLLEGPVKGSQRSGSFILNEIPQPASLDGNNPNNELLERAARLRKEIKELESQVTSKRPTPPSADTIETAIEYTDISDSVWSFSYRFSDEPELSEEDSKKDETRRRRFYSGKVVLKFRSDGYTEILDQEQVSGSAESSSRKVEIVKVWGWDIEESNEVEDGESKYLIFSMDVNLPVLNGGTTQQRFYYQARLDQDPRSKTILLSKGTVTIKSDVVQKSVRWGFFSPAGILAQFRYVGDFIAKPASKRNTL
jgi:hypothetical protein